MRNWIALFSILLSTCLLLAGINAAQDRGAIGGTIVDENGAPVVKAKVNADPADGRPRGSLVRYVETDASGHFLIDRLVWGKYKVFAKKEDAGYPDVSWSFYSNDVFSVVAITPTTPTAELRIQLGPKAGVLIGSVTNAVTGAPVNAGLRLSRAADPNKWISTSVPPEYRVLLPSATDVLLEASAPGFKTWTLGYPLRLQLGSEMHLDIFLEPSYDPNLHASRFLIPDGYVGWLQLEYGVKDAKPVAVEDDVKVFKFPKSGTLETSSSGPDRGAAKEYFYYAEDRPTRPIPTDYRSGHGMIWGEHDGTVGGVFRQFWFFVGTEEQYKKQIHH